MKFLKAKYIVFLVPFILYSNTFWNKFSFDDNFNVQNERVKKGWTAIPEIFTSYYHQEENNTFGYRPVVQSMFAIEHSLFGESPAMNHFINVLLYSLLCLMIFVLLKRLMPETQENILLLIVILFAVHPVHTEVVASNKNREEIVAMLLGICSLYLFTLYTENKKYIYLIPIPVLIFLSVLSKENALTYPLIFPLIFILKTDIKTFNYKKYIVPGILTVIFFFIAWYAWKLPGKILPFEEKELFYFENPLHSDHSFSAKLYTTGITLWFYIKILFVPYPLRYFYGYNMLPDDTINIIASVIGFIIFACLFIFAILNIRKHKELSFFIFFFLISISVFTNYFIPVNGIVGERLTFQASLGFCGFIITAISMFKLRITFYKNAMKILYAVFVIFALMTFQRNRDWKNFETILKADIHKLENSAKGQVIYASWHMGQLMNKKSLGQCIHPEAVDRVIFYYNKSIDIYPNYYSSYNNAGTLFYHIKNKPDSALKYFRKALAIKPDYIEALYNSGICFNLINMTDSSIVQFEKLLKYKYNYSGAWVKLSEIYREKKDFEKARIMGLNALIYDSLSDVPLINMGNICLLQLDTAKAVEWWEKAIEKNPHNPNLLFGLSRYFKQYENAEKADKYQKMFDEEKK